MPWFWFIVFAAILVFLVLLLATCIPYTFLKNCCVNASKLSISILGCASCGVFIATCFLGLVPHVRHQEMQLRSNSTVLDSIGFLPSTDQLVVIGFVIILIVEQVIHGIGSSVGKNNEKTQTNTNIKFRKFLDEEGGDDNEPLVEVENVTGDDNDDIIFRQASNSPNRTHSNGGISDSSSMNIRVWFLLLGMSVHSFFEGVALGVQNDINAFYQIMIAVLFHEILCCISYGVQLAKHNASRKYAWTSSIFLSATIPIGMVLATMIDGIDNDSRQKIGRYWLEGLAAGTFVHVALVELLPMELHSEEGGHGHSHNVIPETSSQDHQHSHSHNHGLSHWTNLVKSLFVASGILIFVIIKLFIGDHH